VTPPADPWQFMLRTPPYWEPPLLMDKAANEPPSEEPPGPEEREGPEDSTEPRSRAEAAIDSAKKAREYANIASGDVSKLDPMIRDLFLNPPVTEEDREKAAQVDTYYREAVDNAGWAQDAARRAADHAVEALLSPGAADIHAQFAADDAAEALRYSEAARFAYNKAVMLRHTF